MARSCEIIMKLCEACNFMLLQLDYLHLSIVIFCLYNDEHSTQTTPCFKVNSHFDVDGVDCCSSSMVRSGGHLSDAFNIGSNSVITRPESPPFIQKN
jgi:hypothetical protein